MLILLFLCFKYDKLLNMNSPAFDSAISGHGHDYRHGSRSSRYAQLLFVLVTLSLVIFFRDAPQFHTLGIIFVSIVLEALPFMLLGTLIGGFIEVFIPRESGDVLKFERWLQAAILFVPVVFLWAIYGQSLGTHLLLSAVQPMPCHW